MKQIVALLIVASTLLLFGCEKEGMNQGPQTPAGVTASGDANAPTGAPMNQPNGQVQPQGSQYPPQAGQPPATYPAPTTPQPPVPTSAPTSSTTPGQMPSPQAPSGSLPPSTQQVMALEDGSSDWVQHNAGTVYGVPSDGGLTIAVPQMDCKKFQRTTPDVHLRKYNTWCMAEIVHPSDLEDTRKTAILFREGEELPVTIQYIVKSPAHSQTWVVRLRIEQEKPQLDKPDPKKQAN